MMLEPLCDECFMDKQRGKSREQSVLLSECVKGCLNFRKRWEIIHWVQQEDSTSLNYVNKRRYFKVGVVISKKF